eukprot:Phypoly_transcript_08640.p1 GENE.Phypoly_transcript_08640~~Phypoly_transcript_08640.p1  ORF type:complete len:470 (+),score=70.41 Phypoly_transcript_08640:86-1411(+)
MGPTVCPLEKEEPKKENSIFDYVNSSNLQGVLEKLEHGSEQERNVNTTDQRGNSLLHVAALRENVEIVELLLSKGATIDVRDSGDHTPLHFAANEGSIDIVKLLVEKGASLSAVNKDVRLDLKGIPLFVTGGKTPLHFAAEQGYDDCVEYLLQKGADRNLKDNDGYTPVDLAYINSREISVKFLDPSGTHVLENPDLTKEQRFALDYKKRAQRIIAEKPKPPQAHSSYTPLHPDLFTLDERFFDTEFIEAIRSGDEKKLKAILEEVTPRVYIFKMFNSEFCTKMIEEIKNFEKSGMPITRPNSMNRYGAVLDEIGFGAMMDNLMNKYISPFARFLFADVGGDNLNERHAFVVQYKIGEDLNLKEHTDRSAVTLNVCLGKDFTGGNLLFKGIKGTPSEHVENFEYAHVVGKGLLHLGKHIHQADNITSGERYNLIVWCRSKV